MRTAILLLVCFMSTSAFAAEVTYLQCSIPSSSGSYIGADGQKIVTSTPAIDLQITVDENNSQISQVFKSGDDTYSFTTKAQFTSTNILYKWTRRYGFVRTDRFNIGRKTLVVEFTVIYPGRGNLAPRTGVCEIIPHEPTRI